MSTSTFIDFDTSGYNDSYTLRENLETSIQGNRVNITSTTDTVDWKYNDFLSAQTAYTETLKQYKSALSTANQQINTNIDNNAKKYSSEIVDDIKIGSVNLIEFSKLDNNGYLNFTKQRPKITVEYNKDDTQPAIQLLPDYSVIKKGYEYVLSFNFKKISGIISKIGMPLKDTECENVQIYIDNTLYSLNTGSDVSFTVDYTADTNEHKVIIKFKTTSDVKEQNIIQFNRKLTTAFKVDVSNIQLEVGNIATEYKPNDADIIEARTNILKGGIMSNLTANSKENKKQQIFKYSDNTLTTKLKKNTEYVFSVERTLCKKGSATSFTLLLWWNSSKYQQYTIPIDGSSAQYITIIPKYDFEDDSEVCVYAGLREQTANNTLTFVGLKLAEGNKYVGYEATPEEKESIMTLQDAMKGTTEIEGGLVLTNMIELKNSNGNVTAGISGLDTNKSFIENGTGGTFDGSLRFWAGSDLIGSNSAPFRVYNDGRVFGTHFYGYNSATIINSSNYSNYLTDSCIDLTKTGNMIYLDSSLIKENNNLYLSINLKFPDNIEDYIGTELTIINPHKIPINKCGYIINPDYCTAYNAYDQSSYSKLEKIELTGEYKEGICTSSVYVATYKSSDKKFTMKNKVADSDNIGNFIPYRPKFATMYYYGLNSSCAMGGITDGWIPKKTIQVFKLISTPYIYFVSETGVIGTKSVKEFGDIKTISGYNFQQYAVWCLKEEMLSLPASLTYIGY